jgi:hypothetical protein
VAVASEQNKAKRAGNFFMVCAGLWDSTVPVRLGKGSGMDWCNSGSWWKIENTLIYLDLP